MRRTKWLWGAPGKVGLRQPGSVSHVQQEWEQRNAPSNGANRVHGAVAHRRPWGWAEGLQEGPAWIQDDIKDQMPTPKPGIIEVTV